MQINYIAIGKRIKHFRKQKNIAQAKLSELATVEPSTISHIERGTTKVSLPTLLKIANSLNVSLDELVYDSLNINPHISNKELNKLLFDCNNSELKSIVEIVKCTKSILRK